MMNLKKLLASSMFALFLCVGCGKDEGGDSKNWQDAQTRYKDGDCGSDIVRDYNRTSIPCRFLNTFSQKKDIQECIDAKRAFLNKYPDISCYVGRDTNHGLSKEKVLIDANSMRSILKEAEDLIK